MKRAFIACLCFVLSPLAYAVTDLGGTTGPACVEDPCDTYRFPPKCTDANLDGVCDGYTAKSWSKNSAITSVPAVCNAGDNATANPDINPVFSATIKGTGAALSTIGLSISSSTGAITGTPSTGGTFAFDVVCANDLGSRTDVLTADIADVGGPGGIPALGYFVDCTSGNDASAGTTQATAWKTLDKVQTAVVTAGSRVWIKAGGTCQLNQPLRFNWSGVSAANPSIIGSYYVTSNVAYINSPTNWTASRRPSDYTYTAARPILEGTYKDSCRLGYWNTSKCAWNTADANPQNRTPGTAVPTSVWDGLVDIRSGQYMTLQDVEIKSSAGSGINFSSSASFYCRPGEGVCETSNITVQRVKVNGVSGNGIYVGATAQWVVRDSEITKTNLAVADGQPCSRNSITACGSLIFVGGSSIASTICAPCYGLIENNDIHDSFGEAIGLYGVSYVLARGNWIGSHGSSGINMGSSESMVAEQNMVFGGDIYDPPSADNTGLARKAFWTLSNELAGADSGIPRLGDSWGGQGTNGKRNITRNNLAGNATAADCIESYTLGGGDYVSLPFYVSALIAGNTCVSKSTNPTLNLEYAYENMPAIIEAIDVGNNLFTQYGGSSSNICQIYTTSSKINVHHNQFTTTPSWSQCRSPGTGEVINASTGLGAFNFSTASWTSKPAESDFLPSGGAGTNAGIAMTTTSSVYINTGTAWDWVLSKRAWLPACNTTTTQVAKTDWLKPLYFDYCGNTRGGSPDMGGREHN